jgi:hypothetical protein
MLGYARRLDHARFAVLGIGATVDVSCCGLRFLAFEAVPTKGRLDIQLVLDGRMARIRNARVVRTQARGDRTYEVAVEFLEADPETRAAIDGFVRERVEGQSLAG